MRGITYSNVYQLSDGTVFDFHRGHGFDPNYLISHDQGQTFDYGGHLLYWSQNPNVNRLGRPYVRYAQHADRIHLITTEDHPRGYDNSIYHAYIEEGKFYQSDGAIIGPIDVDGEATIQPNHLTQVFQGNARNVGWTVDLEIDTNGYPYAAISVQKNDHDKPVDKKGNGESGWDLRFYYARWDGTKWNTHHMAYAGSRLYAKEADYSGLVALHPQYPDIVYISTNSNPVTGEYLISKADGRRHHEILEGHTSDGGETWVWNPITKDSSVDNLRPIVPDWESGKTALLWLRGEFTTFRNYRQEIVLQVLSPNLLLQRKGHEKALSLIK